MASARLRVSSTTPDVISYHSPDLVFHTATSRVCWARLKPILASVVSLIPISDENPTRRTPVITLVLIGLNIFTFFFIQPDPRSCSERRLPTEERFYFETAPIPCQFEDECPATIPGTAGQTHRRTRSHAW